MPALLRTSSTSSSPTWPASTLSSGREASAIPLMKSGPVGSALSSAMAALRLISRRQYIPAGTWHEEVIQTPVMRYILFKAKNRVRIIRWLVPTLLLEWGRRFGCLTGARDDIGLNGFHLSGVEDLLK